MFPFRLTRESRKRGITWGLRYGVINCICVLLWSNLFGSPSSCSSLSSAIMYVNSFTAQISACLGRLENQESQYPRQCEKVRWNAAQVCTVNQSTLLTSELSLRSISRYHRPRRCHHFCFLFILLFLYFSSCSCISSFSLYCQFTKILNVKNKVISVLLYFSLRPFFFFFLVSSLSCPSFPIFIFLSFYLNFN